MRDLMQSSHLDGPQFVEGGQVEQDERDVGEQAWGYDRQLGISTFSYQKEASLTT